MDSQTPAEKIRSAGAVGGNADLDSEERLWSGTYSKKDMTGIAIGAAILGVVLLIVLLAVPALRSNGWVWLGWIGLSIVGAAALYLVYLYRKLSRSYELTSQRFMHRVGILTRVSDRIELIDIDDVRIKQGPVQAILGVGSIMIRSSDSSHPELVLIGIEDARQVADKIDDARRAERRKRGLHIEAI